MTFFDSQLFTKRHYRPVNFDPSIVHDEIHYAVPAHWRDQAPPKEGLDDLVMVGTSFKEPNCKNLLCSLGKDNSQHCLLPFCKLEHIVTCTLHCLGLDRWLKRGKQKHSNLAWTCAERKDRDYWLEPFYYDSASELEGWYWWRQDRWQGSVWCIRWACLCRRRWALERKRESW